MYEGRVPVNMAVNRCSETVFLHYESIGMIKIIRDPQDFRDFIKFRHFLRHSLPAFLATDDTLEGFYLPLEPGDLQPLAFDLRFCRDTVHLRRVPLLSVQRTAFSTAHPAPTPGCTLVPQLRAALRRSRGSCRGSTR